MKFEVKEIQPIVKPIKTLTLTLSEEEAWMLQAIIGLTAERMRDEVRKGAGSFGRNLYQELVHEFGDQRTYPKEST